jgi:hypothetical protein
MLSGGQVYPAAAAAGLLPITGMVILPTVLINYFMIMKRLKTITG